MTRYLSLAEYFWLAEQVTGTSADLLVETSRIDVATSAIHAPGVGFDDEEFYPDLYDKAAVLTCRLAWSRALPDGNGRAAWAALALFLELNGGRWIPDPPSTDDAEDAMLAVGNHTLDEDSMSDWLRVRVAFADP